MGGFADAEDRRVDDGWRTSTGPSFSSMAPASIVASVRMSSMMASSVFEEAEMSPRYSCCFSLSGPICGLASSSLKPMMLVSGVRSS